MTQFAIVKNNVPHEIFGSFVDDEGTQYPANWTANASLEDLALIKVYPIEELPVPEGKVITGSELFFDSEENKVFKIYNFKDKTYTSTEVDEERNRRIASGITFQGVRYQTRKDNIHNDQSNIMEAGAGALAALMSGSQPGNYEWQAPGTEFQWIAEDNSKIPMDAQTMLMFATAFGTMKTAHFMMASFIKDQLKNGVALDIKDDVNWPSTIM